MSEIITRRGFLKGATAAAALAATALWVPGGVGAAGSFNGSYFADIRPWAPSVSGDIPQFSAAVQFDYKNRTFQWGFRVSGAIQTQFPGAVVNEDGYFNINNRNAVITTHHYGKPIGYLFHGSVGDFRYSGDAPWTSHRVKQGDTLELFDFLSIFHNGRLVALMNVRMRAYIGS